jgi:acyl-CoA synthetase (AMP-forming)/AMP-acid ligase II
MMPENIKTLYEILTTNAEQYGDELAAASPANTLTHNEFLDRVDHLAGGLSASGLEHGDRICVLAQNSLEYLGLYGACAKTGTIAYPINWRLSAEEVGTVLKLADPSCLIVGVEHIAQLEGLDLGLIELKLVIGEAPVEGFRPLAELYSASVQPPAEVSESDPFVIISTAAVAGVPRGAVLTHGNMLHANDQIIESIELSASDRHLAALPLFHITGLGLSLATNAAGGANVVTPAFDPALSARMIDEHDVTLMADFPPVLQMLMEARGEASWESLKMVFGLDSPDVIQKLQTETSARFYTGFGQSETSGAVTFGPADERPGSAGKPLPQATIRLVDESDDDVPLGQPGEIVVQGPLVFAGYWRDPDATAFTGRNGWHHTGDLGRFDEDGYLYYVGRKPEKELIKSGGENVYPAEVEHVILDLPQVAAVCVIGVPDEKYGETVKAVIELDPGGELSAESVQQAVADRIASFKKPRLVEFVEALPRLESGEVDREQVKDSFG